MLDSAKTAKQLVTALTGKNVGSRVLVAIAPKDGLAKRLKREEREEERHAAVRDRREERAHAAGRATGDAVAPVAGLPTVALAADGKPTITIPRGVAAPTSLVVAAADQGHRPGRQPRARRSPSTTPA